MADYYVDLNGKVTKKKAQSSKNTNKKKKNTDPEYIIDSSGWITRVSSDEEDDIAPVKETKKESTFDFFQKGAFDDGYQLGDVTKSILGTVGDVGVGLARGALGFGEGISDLVSYGVSKASDLVGADDFSDKAKEFAKRNSTNEILAPADDYLDEYSVLGRTSDAILQGIGQRGALMGTVAAAVAAAPAIGVGAIGAAGTSALTHTLLGMSAAGSGMSEAYAYEGGATDREANIHGLIAAGSEVISEMLFGGLGKAINAVGFSTGLFSADDMLAKKVSSMFTNQFAKNAAELSIKSGAEGVEELISGTMQAISKKMTYMSDKDWKEIFEDENLLEQFVVGAVTSGIAQSGFAPGKKSGSLAEANKTGRDFITGLTQNEQAVVDKVYENRLAEMDGKVSGKEKAKIYDSVIEDMKKGYLDTDTIEGVVGGDEYGAYKTRKSLEDSLKKQEKKLTDEIAELRKAPLSIEVNERFESANKKMADVRNQLSSLDIKGVREQLDAKMDLLTQNDSLLRESYNEKARRGQAFEADLTKYNVKQQEVVKRAVESGILNNTNRTHEFVDLVSKISADKGVLFDFTNNQKLKESGFAVEGKTVNGFIKDGNITLNIDSNNAWKTVVGHEITHVLEDTALYSELQNAVKEYALKKGEYYTRYDEFSKLYKGVENANIENELTSELVGEYLFADDQFINNLSVEKPNIFKKIFDEIKYLYKVATAGSKEARQLEKVKRAFEKAYRENVKTTENADADAKYSMSGKNAKTANYLTLDKAIKMEDVGQATSEEIRQSTGWFRGYDGKWRFEISDRDMEFNINGFFTNPDVIRYKELENKFIVDTENMTEAEERELRSLSNALKGVKKSPKNLGDYIKHDKLFEAYPQLKDIRLKFDHLSDSELGAYDSERNEIILNYRLKDNTKQLEDTLIHEIQHAVQRIEGFSTGSSPEYWQSVRQDIIDTIRGARENLDLWLEDIGYPEFSNKSIQKVVAREKTLDEHWKDCEEFKANSKYADQIARCEAELSEFQRQYDEITNGMTPFEQYQNTAGEIEARDVSKRRWRSEEALRDVRPDIDRTDVVFANTRYSLSDSENNKLTQEQAEYFKDSKVRDENGNLKVMYHGTSKGSYTVFDTYGSNFGLFGQGSYFTDNKSVAESYTEKGRGNNKQVYEAYLNIKNPLDMDAPADADAWRNANENIDFPDSGTNEDFFRAMKEYFIDNEYSRWEAGEEAWDTITAMGYDGITHIGGGRFNKADDTRHRVFIAYDPEQIKNTDNLKPKNSADIRYSLSQDSTGRELSDGQKEYFKDSKIKDEDGNLKVMYHGTENDFTIFNTMIEGGKNGIAEGYGIYFADTSEVTDAYGGRQLSGYLNIKRPATSYRKTIKRGELEKLIKATAEAEAQQFVDDGDYDNVSDALKDTWISNYVYTYDMPMAKAYKEVTSQILSMNDNDMSIVQEVMGGLAIRDYEAAYKFYDILKKTTGIDGFVTHWKNDTLSTGKAQIVLAFDSNQFKNIDNLNPTDSADIRHSLTDSGQVAPVGTRLSDLRLQTEEDVAPIEDVTDTNVGNNNVSMSGADEFAPMTEAEAMERDSQQSDRIYSLDEDDMPPVMDAPYSESITPDDPLKDRNIEDVGNRSVKAYMYENPEVKPFFQEEAQMMLGELRRSVKGERNFNDQLYYESSGESGWFGTKRMTSDEIAYLLDNFKYTYADIEKGLLAIIEDNGKENNAISKRIEFMLDERLRLGYTYFETGDQIPANQEYINLLNEKQVTEYSDESWNNWLRSLPEADIAPAVETQAYEAIKPRPDKLSAEEAQWAKNKMARVKDPGVKKGQRVATVLTKEPEGKKADGKYGTMAMNLLVSKGWAVEKLAKQTKNRELEGRYNSIGLAEGRAQEFIGNGADGVRAINDIRKEVEKSGLEQELFDYVYNLHNIDRMSLESKAQAQEKQLLDENPLLKELSGRDTISKIAEKIQNASEQIHLEDIINKKYLDRKLEMYYNDVAREEAAADLFNKIKELIKLREVKNKPVYGYSVTAEDSKKTVLDLEKKHPQLKQYANELYKINDHLRSVLVDGGVISQETANLWSEMYPHYMPIRRDKGNAISVPLDTNKTGINAPIKGATGGDSDILPLFRTLADRALQTYKAVAKNRFGVELKNTLRSTIDATETDVDGVIDGIENNEDLLQEGKHGNAPTFTVFENGERVTFEITEDLFDALKPTNKALTYTNKVLNKASNLHRGVLTEYNPVFTFNNAIKDTQDVLINSQHPLKTYKNFPKAFMEVVRNGNWAKEYARNGGEHSGYFDKRSNSFKKEKNMLVKTIGFPLNVVSSVNNVIEMTPRLAEYIASREAGRSVDVSMLDASRVTTNFNDGGDFTKFLNRNGVTFLNASVQGAAQAVRNVREAKMNGLKGWLQLATKFAIAGLPTILLNGLLWDDDEDYEELSDYVKQNYYVVAKYDDSRFVRIPKGRALSVIQTAFEQTKGALTGDDDVDLMTFFKNAIGNLGNLAPNNPVENNILSPIFDVADNETWYGEDLLPTRLQDLPTNEQYDESTDALSRWLGENLDPLGLGPYKINYLLDQYSGGVGDVFLPMYTPEAESGDDSKLGQLFAPLRDKFTTDSVLNNQNVSDFYDTSDALTANANRSAATDTDILANKYFNSMSSEIGKLYGEKREIQNRSDLTDSEKYYLVREVQKKINALVEEALTNVNETQGASEPFYGKGNIDLNNRPIVRNEDGSISTVRSMSFNEDGKEILVPTVVHGKIVSDEEAIEHYYKTGLYLGKFDTVEEAEAYAEKLHLEQEQFYANKGSGLSVSGDYATIGGLHYRKNDDGEWLKINENQLDKQSAVTSGLGISPAEYWSNKTEYDYAYESPDKYALAKSVGGYDIYKKYTSELYDIKADKDKNGKSISGSRKAKVADYINNLDADYETKIILYKSEYNADDTYNYEIIEYLNNREDITYEEMVLILKELGFNVDSKGNVTWD